MKKLNEVFSEWETTGFFSYLDSYDVPWKTTATATYLDIAYHGTKSGNKLIAPLLERFLNESEELTSENADKIAHMVFTLFGKNWSKLWDTLSFDYNPIENYRMVETETAKGTNSGSESGTNSMSYTGTDKYDKSGTNTSTGKQTTSGTDTNSVYGFNSTSAVDSDSSKTTGSMDTTDSGTNTETDTETRNLADSGSHSVSTSGNTSTDRELTRSGNIGVTTSQQMIESERALWNWYFYDVVFKDLDSVLTLTIY